MSSNKIPDKVSIKNFKDLIVYQKAMELSDKIYGIIGGFSDFEKWGTSKQYNFLNNALGSASEVRCHLEHAFRRGYISKETHEELELETQTIIKLLLGMMKKIKNELNF